MGKANRKWISIRPDGFGAAPGQMLLVHHGAIQQPKRIQDIEGEIRDNPLRGKILGEALGLIAAVEEFNIIYFIIYFLYFILYF